MRRKNGFIWLVHIDRACRMHRDVFPAYINTFAEDMSVTVGKMFDSDACASIVEKYIINRYHKVTKLFSTLSIIVEWYRALLISFPVPHTYTPCETTLTSDR